MSVILDWLIEGEVIYQHWWGIGTMEDVRYVDQRMLELYADSPDRHLIHCIVNGLHQEKTEVGIQAARRGYTVLDHAQTGWVLVVIDNPVLNFFINIVLQLRTKTRFRMTKTVDGGINFLKDVDTTINWDAADWSIIERFEKEMNSEADS